MKKITLALSALICIGSTKAYAQLSLTTNPTLTQMISNIVGPGNTVSNVTMNCPSGAYATFSNGNSTNLGLTSGALLTTGDASAVNGTGGAFASVDLFTNGDPLLTSIAGATTYDRCRIEFDIIPQCNSLQMQYVFGSEEYPEWVNLGYNDAFGFFISGPNPSSGNYNNYNIALVPSSTLPVTIDNINSFTNSQYYVNNQTGSTIVYDGFTTPLTASVSVVPCSSYHMIIVIADGGDGVYDSGVFLTYQGLQCPSPQVTLAGNTNICPSQSTTLTASNMTNYVWSPATGLNVTTGSTVIASPTVTTTYTVTGTSGACNTSTSTITVNVAPGPPVTVAASATSVCPGSPTNITANGALTYTWSPSSSLSSTTGATVVASPTVTTTYTVTGNTNGCISTSSVTINVGSITAQAGPDATICDGDSTQLNVTGGTSYSWSPATGLSDPTIANPYASPSTTTTYTVTASAGTCTANDTITVVVNPVPVVTGTPTSVTVCQGTSTFLSASGANSYSWSPAGGLNTTTGSVVSATPATSTSYIVTGTSSGCSNTDTLTVTIIPVPDPSITAAGPYCSGAMADTMMPATSGGTWDGTGITDSVVGVFNPVTSGVGTFNIIYSITSGVCTRSDTMSITVNPTPIASINAAGPFCVNAAATNLSAATGGGTWAGTGITNASNGTFNPQTAGTGTHSIIYTMNNAGCIDDDTLNIVVNPMPNATITQAGPLCANSTPINFNAATPGGTWSGTGITNPSTGTFNPSTAGAGTYTINYSVTVNGCTSTSSTMITVNPNANATITAAGPFCVSDPAVNLTAAQGGGNWTGTGITNTSAGTFNPGTAGAGTHVITYMIAGMCGDTATTSVVVSAPPPAPAAPSTGYCSYDAMAPLTATATNNGTITWYSDAALTNVVGTGSPFTPVPAITTTTTYYVTETVGGCEGAATPVTITVNPAPAASFTPSQTTGMVPFSVSFLNTSTSNCTYSWAATNSASIAANAAGADAEFTVPGNSTVTLVVTSAAGCTDTVQMTIFADAISMITVPNVFTPNGDNVNDLFEATHFGIEMFHGEIYDRWGLKVHEWSDVNAGWNGITDKGGEAPDGTYYYLINASGIDGQNYAFHGFLTLLRKK
jgi:gliding motility-associated-like protein